jgi:hypothetical protein
LEFRATCGGKQPERFRCPIGVWLLVPERLKASDLFLSDKGYRRLKAGARRAPAAGRPEYVYPVIGHIVIHAQYIVSLKHNVTIVFSGMLMSCPVYGVIRHWF